jgi:O-antigen/teichoic acid export membrane protein
MAIPAVLLAPVSRLLMVDLPRLHAVAPDRVRDFFLRVTVIGVMASAAISVPFWLASGLAVPLLYGSEFAAAAPLTLVLLLDAATLGLGIAAGPIFRTYNRTDLPIRATLAILVVGLPAAHAATSTWGAGGAALAYAGMTFVSRAVSYVQCLRVIGR